MSKPMTIGDAIGNLHELITDAKKMRTIVDDPHYPFELRYRAVVIEEALLQVAQSYLTHIDQLKELSLNGYTFDKGNS